MRIICTKKLRIICTPIIFVSYMYTNTVYYMHTKHVCMIYTPKSIFAYQYHEFLFYLAYHLYKFSWDRAHVIYSYDGKAKLVFSVTWSVRNNFNMLIWCKINANCHYIIIIIMLKTVVLLHILVLTMIPVHFYFYFQWTKLKKFSCVLCEELQFLQPLSINWMHPC